LFKVILIICLQVIEYQYFSYLFPRSYDYEKINELRLETQALTINFITKP